MAYVKVSAAYLAHVGPVDAEKHLYELLTQLGELGGIRQRQPHRSVCRFSIIG
ncbi:MAG: hypothetical protein IPJ38_15610 [Dechloromonas sp.]|uniref:Uncharacterized protein n=1 Tax=Candidatus Dechloromonas phosphorivorans TaxID=2899244 RepID=A0A935JYG3_9RHOO|nr:hypothetical protein [Candidatus Dechloromonas phosphorivorans]